MSRCFMKLQIGYDWQDENEKQEEGHFDQFHAIVFIIKRCGVIGRMMQVVAILRCHAVNLDLTVTGSKAGG